MRHSPPRPLRPGSGRRLRAPRSSPARRIAAVALAAAAAAVAASAAAAAFLPQADAAADAPEISRAEAARLVASGLELSSEGRHREAIAVYDGVLAEWPRYAEALNMKGVALSSIGDDAGSIRQFYRAHQADRSDALALAGLGMGLGNLGEYAEAERYLDEAVLADPEWEVARNYRDVVARVLAKFPYEPTPRPAMLENRGVPAAAPEWTRSIAAAWSAGRTTDAEFAAAFSHLAEIGVVGVPRPDPLPSESGWRQNQQGRAVPEWVKKSAAAWGAGASRPAEFVPALRHMFDAGLASPPPRPLPDVDAERYRLAELSALDSYLHAVASAAGGTRYVEHPNPSGDVIKKFMRDYIKWNFDDEAARAATSFPSPGARAAPDGTVVVTYHMYVNEQPSGLPLDHVGTLSDSLAYWEGRDLTAGGSDAQVRFEHTTRKDVANVWVTWVVRDLGEGVLGHAHVGKGIVEVALGDYACDGTFQLYDVDTVRRIMTHELGHTIGLLHSDSRASVMYPSMRAGYAYCLLG